MATKIEDLKRVTVELTQAELSSLLVQPAKDRKFIDFDPTRININQQNSGEFVVIFARVEKDGTTE